MEQTNSLYDNVVRTTYAYLGPAADRFVARQIHNHLKKKPEQFKKNDLRELIDWIKLAMSLLTDDEKLINEYITSLEALAKNSKNNHAGKSKQHIS